MKTTNYFQSTDSVREDWLLLLVNAFDEHIVSYTHIVKCAFLLSRSISIDWIFEAGAYGPICNQVWQDLEMLVANKYVLPLDSYYGKQSRGIPLYNYAVSLKGHRKALDLKKKVNPALSKYIDELGAWAGPLEFTQIIASIASKYPEFRESMVFSQFRDR